MGLQCGRGDGAAEDPDPCFRDSLLGAASMWPRRWSRGRPRRRFWIITGHRCFNVAAAMEPRKTFAEFEICVALDALQCGRGDGAAEDTMQSLISKLTIRASMWPRRWSRGRRSSPRRSRDGFTCFNVAAAMEPRKTSPEWASARGLARFNVAAAMEPRKTIVITPLGGFPGIASMWLRRWSRGRLEMLARWHAFEAASMWPRRWSRGRPRWKSVETAAENASMWPRRWSRGRRI